MMEWPQDGSLSRGPVVFTLHGFEQSHVQNPGIDSNYWVYNGDWFLMPGNEVNSRPVFENHNDSGWTHRYFVWSNGYWRGTCSSSGSPYPIGQAPWDDAQRWGGVCDMLVKSDATHPTLIDSNATWMVYSGAVYSSNPSDFLPVNGVSLAAQRMPARSSPPMMEEVDPSPQPAVVVANSSDGGASGSGAHPSSAAVSKESFLKILSNLPGPGPRDHDGEDTATENDWLFDMIDQYMKDPQW